MAETRETLAIEILARDRASSALKQVGGKIKGFSKRAIASFKGVAAAFLSIKAAFVAVAAFLAVRRVLGGVVSVANDLVQAFSQFEQQQGKFRAVFKNLTDDATEFAEALAGSLGRGVAPLQNFLARLQDTFVPLGLARDLSFELSKTVTQLALDVSAFNEGFSEAQVINSFTSALVGNTEAVRSFGISITQGRIQQESFALGVGKTAVQLTAQEKVLITLSLLIKGSADALGQAARETETFEARTRQFNDAVATLRRQFGEALVKAINKAITELGGIDKVVALLSLAFVAVVEFSKIAIKGFTSVAKATIGLIEDLGGFQVVGATIVATIQTIALAFQAGFFVVKLSLNEFKTGLAAIKLSFDVVTIGAKALFAIVGGGAAKIAQKVTALFRDLVSGVRTTLESISVVIPDVILDGVKDAEIALEVLQANLGSTASTFVEDFTEAGEQARAALEAFSIQSDKGIVGNSQAIKDLKAEFAKFIIAVASGVGEISPIFKDLENAFEGANAPALDLEKSLAAIKQALADLGTEGKKDIEKLGEGAKKVKPELTKLENALNAVSSNVEGAFEQSLTRAFQSIITGSKSASEAFKQFALSIVNAIAGIIAQLIALAIIQTVVGIPSFLKFGGAKSGGILPGGAEDGAKSGGIIPGLQGGGIVKQPSIVAVGEGGIDEAVVPIPKGKIPVELRGSGGQIINFNIFAIDDVAVADFFQRNRERLRSLIEGGMLSDQSFRATLLGET